MIGKTATILFSLGINLIFSGCQPKNEIANIQTIQIATVLSSTIPATFQILETQKVTDVPIEDTNIPAITDTPELLDVLEFPNPQSYAWQLFAGGFSEPIGMASIYNNENILYILEQQGIIKVIQDGNVLDQPFLDIRDRVGDNQNEQGLLGIALDPNFLENKEFYLNYTNNNGDTTISRYQANADLLTADINSEHIILFVDQPFANHNGGNLAFGPDDYLYIGLGDGGSGGDPDGNAQNMDSLLGKMLRIAVTGQEFYAIPSDNPFVDGGGRAEIWASGLRNPWRYSFDRSTGALFIADVRQGEWE
jgi:glucose/arabinose dehydrogenase